MCETSVRKIQPREDDGGDLHLRGASQSSGPAAGGSFLFKTERKSRSFQSITMKVRAEVCGDA